MFIFCNVRNGLLTKSTACCVGHEIVGKAVRVGKNVKNVKVGDRVGVGAQADACLKCEDCKAGNENHCAKMISTYGSVYAEPKEGKSYGGYATYNRTPGHFVVQIPDSLESADAAPMLCGGVTVYSPLKQNGCGPGKKVSNSGGVSRRSAFYSSMLTYISGWYRWCWWSWPLWCALRKGTRCR